MVSNLKFSLFSHTFTVSFLFILVEPLNSLLLTPNKNKELENSKTKEKLDQLRLVMQQKKERREARKLNANPYNGKLNVPTTQSTLSPTSNQLNLDSKSNQNILSKPTITASSSESVKESSSSTTATAIATSITANNESLENPTLAEEVDTVA